MCEQIKAIDFVARNATFKEQMCDETYEQVLNIINSFIELEK